MYVSVCVFFLLRENISLEFILILVIHNNRIVKFNLFYITSVFPLFYNKNLDS